MYVRAPLYTLYVRGEEAKTGKPNLPNQPRGIHPWVLSWYPNNAGVFRARDPACQYISLATTLNGSAPLSISKKNDFLWKGEIDPGTSIELEVQKWLTGAASTTESAQKTAGTHVRSSCRQFAGEGSCLFLGSWHFLHLFSIERGVALVLFVWRLGRSYIVLC